MRSSATLVRFLSVAIDPAGTLRASLQGMTTVERNRGPWWLVGAGVLALVGCRGADADEPRAPMPAPRQQAPAPPDKPEPPTTMPQFEDDMIVRFHMHENFDLLHGIQKLLVSGRLEEAKTFARAISEAPDEPGLGAWATRATVVRDRAAALASAKTLDQACQRSARLADACASCHVASNAMPQFRPPEPTPPDRPTIDARMARHQWATDRLWEGVVGGHDDAWDRGLEILAATPLQSPKITGARVHYARDLQRFAMQAHMQKRPLVTGARARAYGQILSTCAGCHTTPVKK